MLLMYALCDNMPTLGTPHQPRHEIHGQPPPEKGVHYPPQPRTLPVTTNNSDIEFVEAMCTSP